MAELDRVKGALVGLAVGDALGTTLEFKSPGTFAPLTDMVGGGPFQLAPGQWTDDTSMALCLAESLVECSGFVPRDQMDRYLRWWREGHNSSTGRCFDIGNATAQALARYETSGDPLAGSTDPRVAGNGSLMRLAPVPIRFRANPLLAVTLCGASSRTTHAARTCVDACRYFGGLIWAALNGVARELFLTPGYSPVPNHFQRDPLCPEIAEVAAGSFMARKPPEIAGSGYVVKSLEAALWAFAHSQDYETGALMAVNLGDDADTTGAIYGQLAGACYGLSGIPVRWVQRLTMKDRIEELAVALVAGLPSSAE
jgi:ADP-ribosyl-[dinitrogen reductase] hydrolase